MALYHCHCTYFNWCRPLIEDGSDETLWICINRKRPNNPVPGTESLFCYWKISFYLEIPQRRIDIFVPPEWRSIRCDKLTEWVGRLRDNPFEDIVLSGTRYEWLPHVLVPYGQSIDDIALPGFGPWPYQLEETLYWDNPRFKYSDGTNLPIRVNREIPRRIINGMEKIFCYWKINLPRSSGHKTEVWVPPEWRGLTKKALIKWGWLLHNNIVIRGNVHQRINLGGVNYKWTGDTVHPEDQNLELLESQGYGMFNYHTPEDTDDDDEDLYAEEPLGQFSSAPPEEVEDEEEVASSYENLSDTETTSKEKIRKPDEEKITEICRQLGINQDVITGPLVEDDERKRRRQFKSDLPAIDEMNTTNE